MCENDSISICTVSVSNHSVADIVSGVARKFSQGVRNDANVSINRRPSLFLDYCGYSVVFIGVCTNCPLL